MQRRRAVLRGIGAGGACAATLTVGSGSALAGVLTGECDPDLSTPHADTAEHFDTTWFGSVFRADDETVTSYDTGGEFPWDPAELVVHVHGWLNDYDCGVGAVELARNAYAETSSTATVTGLAWDSEYSWWNAQEIADGNGPKLAQLLVDLAAENPGTTVRLQGHSLGARVVCEAVQSLADWGETDIVETVVLLAGAVVDGAVSLEGEYGPALEQAVGGVENFWDADDAVLNWAFGAAEFSNAIGNSGVDGTPPANYTDHEVTGEVPGHSSENYLDAAFLESSVLPTVE